MKKCPVLHLWKSIWWNPPLEVGWGSWLFKHPKPLSEVSWFSSLTGGSRSPQSKPTETSFTKTTYKLESAVSLESSHHFFRFQVLHTFEQKKTTFQKELTLTTVSKPKKSWSCSSSKIGWSPKPWHRRTSKETSKLHIYGWYFWNET